MCGIAGLVNLNRTFKSDALMATLQKMGDAIIHRGPDDEGLWADDQAHIGLVHRRLSIRDLSPAGHQPMVSSCRRYVIIYNGEIYSHEEMRKELTQAGKSFKGHSDTEVILEACALWGVKKTCEHMIGMFAFALYDKKTKTLTLARDRVGIKPLYYGNVDGLFLFGSELKALRACETWQPELNHDALPLYLRHNYIPSPHSIYKNVHMLMPGTILTMNGDGKQEIIHFWSLADHIGSPFEDKSNQEHIDALDKLLTDAVGRRLVSDVPVGALLSGGIDSSLVSALMAKTNPKKIKTFSIGFDEGEFNEAPFAKAIADHIGSEHTELYMSSQAALDLVPKLPTLYDEPFADSSQLPMTLISQLTKQHITVVLSGDGGDEVFAGYSRYPQALAIWSKLAAIPAALRNIIGDILFSNPGLYTALASFSPQALKGLFNRVARLSGSGFYKSPEQLYIALISHFQRPEELLCHADVIPTKVEEIQQNNSQSDNFLNHMQYRDTIDYLPNDILTKVDRATMSVSLEARVPLLDHRVIEFGWSLPQHLKYRDGKGKWILREVLNKYVPRHLIERPKMGFGIPIDEWLRGPLKDYMADLLDPKKIKEQGIFKPDKIQELLKAHQSGAKQGYRLWTILMFQAWHQNTF